jgi:hypothetical protein
MHAKTVGSKIYRSKHVYSPFLSRAGSKPLFSCCPVDLQYREQCSVMVQAYSGQKLFTLIVVHDPVMTACHIDRTVIH